MRSVCSFCGKRAKSVEHAWPLWLLALIAAVGTRSGTEAQFGPDGTPIRYWQGPEITVKGVCVNCNTGWMSRLESEAKLILASMMSDIALPLTPETQSLLAHWSVKTAMVFDLFSSARFYSDSERQQLRISMTLPENTRVWLGRYGQSNLLCGEARHLHKNKTQAHNPFGNGYVTTIIARRLIVQVLTIRRKPEFRSFKAILHTKAGPWKRSLIEVWPTAEKTLTWPPAISLSDATTNSLQLGSRFTLLR